MYRVHERHTASPGIEMLPAAPVVEVHPGGGHRRGIQLGTKALVWPYRDVGQQEGTIQQRGLFPLPGIRLESSKYVYPEW
jgi:hypothetical protein